MKTRLVKEFDAQK